MTTTAEFTDLGQQFMTVAHESAGQLAMSDADSFTRYLDTLTRLESQLAALKLELLHQARYLDEAPRVLDHVRNSPRETTGRSTAAIRLGSELAERFPLIQTALQDGRVSLAQTEAIVAGLKQLPISFTRQDLETCQEEILRQVDVLGPTELRILALRLVEVVDPDGAEQAEATRLARQDAHARRTRFLRLRPDFHGSTTITGKLPTADAALLEAQLEALMPALASYPTGELPGREVRRADALVRLANIAANAGELPALGVDRPHVQITLRLETLRTGLGAVGLPGCTEPLTAAEARRLACDAHLIPVVLGGASEPLDVGRAHRLFPKPIRAALTLRDQGCAFPGCDTPPAACEAHHIRPWWNGGETALGNGVLLCPRHHRLVEPDPNLTQQSQWTINLHPSTGLPWFTPPRYIDPRQKPRLHRRHALHPPRPDPDLPPSPEASWTRVITQPNDWHPQG